MCFTKQILAQFVYCTAKNRQFSCFGLFTCTYPMCQKVGGGGSDFFFCLKSNFTAIAFHQFYLISLLVTKFLFHTVQNHQFGTSRQVVVRYLVCGLI